MKYTIISILILGVLIFLVACKSKKVVSNSELENPMMTLAKSTCFGKCKVYNVKIHKNKTVSYEGIKNVENIGIFSSDITEVEYQSLVALFEAANFQSLESTYLTNARDAQKTTLGFSQKEVQYQNRAASNELKAITKAMDNIIEKLEWEKR